jgi:hypothetical protein
LAHFLSLKVVDIKLVGASNFPLADWEETVRAAFPALVRRGLLRVTQSECMHGFPGTSFVLMIFFISGPIDGAHEGWE